jgi:hypothetical protein
MDGVFAAKDQYYCSFVSVHNHFQLPTIFCNFTGYRHGERERSQPGFIAVS